MASAGRPPSSALDHATRQQLDELDALMQRMLALPVNPPEDLAHLAEEGPPRETASVSLGVQGHASPPLPEPVRPAPDKQARREEEAVQRVAALSSAGHSLPPLPPALKGPAASSHAPPAPVENPFSGLGPPQRAKGESGQPPPRPGVTPPRVAWPLRPLWWINRGFDGGTAWLGPVGRRLRGPGGRALLGWAGLLLLAAALAWLALDGIGWTW